MLDKWKNPEYIFKNSIIAVASRLDGDSFTDDKIRDRIRELEGSFNADIKKIDIEASGLSSSMIRQAAERGEDISCFVPKDVAEYIKMNGSGASDSKMLISELKSVAGEENIVIKYLHKILMLP